MSQELYIKVWKIKNNGFIPDDQGGGYEKYELGDLFYGLPIIASESTQTSSALRGNKLLIYSFETYPDIDIKRGDILAFGKPLTFIEMVNNGIISPSMADYEYKIFNANERKDIAL